MLRRHRIEEDCLTLRDSSCFCARRLHVPAKLRHAGEASSAFSRHSKHTRLSGKDRGVQVPIDIAATQDNSNPTALHSLLQEGSKRRSRSLGDIMATREKM